MVVNSFDGIPVESSTANFEYFLFGLKETTKPDDIAKNYYLIEDYQVAKELEGKLSAAFIRHEVEGMQERAKTLTQKQIPRLTNEDELFKALEIERPKPKVETKIEPKPQPATTEKAQAKEETKVNPKTEVKVEPKKSAPKSEEKPQPTTKETPRADSKVEGLNKKIYLFVPIGIPGMGKSHFATNHLEKSLKAADD